MASKCINTYLDGKGIKRSTRGYLYLSELIEHMIFHPQSTLKEGYKVVASKFKETPSKVSGCITYSLKYASNLNTVPKSFIHDAVETLSPNFRVGDVQQGMNPFDVLLMVNQVLSGSPIVKNIQKLDHYHMPTFIHSFHVAVLSVTLASELGIRDDMLRDICLGALLHDVGKLSVPREILDKPGKLTEEEFRVIMNHPIQSFAIACCSSLSEMVRSICLLHHRYLDKSGYPDDVPAEYEMSEYLWAVDIVTICDIFSAIVSPRSYSDSESSSVALSQLDAMAEEGKVSWNAVNALRKLVESGRAVIDVSCFSSGK